MLKQDQNGYMAIHYACDYKDANPEILKLLLDAEKRYVDMKKSPHRTTLIKRMAQSCDSRNRSPLYLAVKWEARDEIIEIMLVEPENFYLKGFDHKLISMWRE